MKFTASKMHSEPIELRIECGHAHEFRIVLLYYYIIR